MDIGDLRSEDAGERSPETRVSDLGREKVREAVKICLEYHKPNSRGKTLGTCRTILLKFRDEFGVRNRGDLTPEEILSFLGQMRRG